MFYITRSFICDRLRISKWVSYDLFRATGIGRIPSDRVIDLLNGSRRAGEERLDYIPSDIVTADQLAEETGIPAHSILVWTRRKVKVPPHYRITNQTIRFRRSSFNAWLDKQCSEKNHRRTSRAYAHAKACPSSPTDILPHAVGS